MSGGERFLSVSVSFNQGLVKQFIAPMDILMCDFVSAVRTFGRFRSMRFAPEVDRPTAELLVRSGNAVMVEARRKEPPLVPQMPGTVSAP